MSATWPRATAAGAAVGAVWARAYARVSAVYPEMRVMPWPPPGEDWLTGRALSEDPAAFAQLVDHEVRSIRADWGAEPRPYVAATWALGHYGWYAAFALAGPYLAAGLVPDLVLDGFAVRPGRTLVEVAVRPEGYADVERDGRQAVRAELRRVHAGLVGPVFAAFGSTAHRAPVALWRAAADALAAALWRVGERLGDERGAAAETARVLGDTADGTGPVRPYAGCANFRELTLPDGTPYLTRERNDCCFAYTLDTPSPCITCPRLTDDERVRLVADGMA